MLLFKNYLNTMGKKSFDDLPFNEVDAAILCELSYIYFDDLLPQGHDAKEPLQLSEARRFWNRTAEEKLLAPGEILRSPAYELLELAGRSPRFREVTLRSYHEIINADQEIQFSAMIFANPREDFLLTFRGTDFYTIGWKEDFKMSYLPIIPSQALATEYLISYFKKYQRPITLAGHSKGGNLAVYSAITCPEKYQHLIRDVYNFDGPGFSHDMCELESYKRMVPKIHTYLPQDSFVGMLLERLEVPSIIQSSRAGILGHFPFYWEIHQDRFIRTSLSKQAEKNGELMKEFLDNLSLDERMEFVDQIFTLISPENQSLIFGTPRYNAGKLRSIIKYMRNLSPEDEENLKKVIFTFRDHRKKYHKLPFPLFLFVSED